MIASPAAARVYARALFDIALDANAIDQVADELHAVSSAIDALDPEVRGFFVTPRLRREHKQRIIDSAFEGKVSRPVLGLLHVLIDKRREALLDGIVTELDSLLDEHAGRVRARVTTAQPLGAELADALQAALELRTGRQVVLQQRVDPEVLGGIRVNLGDFVIDGTLRQALSNMRRTLAASQG